MKTILMALSILMAGCSTLQLPADATIQQKSAAYCSDIEAGLQTAELALSMAVSAEKAEYWNKWISGANKARAIYCKGK